MAKLISLSLKGMIIAVISLMVSSFAALLWGVTKTYRAIEAIFEGNSETNSVPYYLIHSVDAFLISIVLFMLAASIYELFIGKLDVPEWIPAHNFYELKNKLGGMIILVMAVEFVGRLFKGQEGLPLLYTALSVAVVSGVLIGFGMVSSKPVMPSKLGMGTDVQTNFETESGPDFAKDAPDGLKQTRQGDTHG